MSVFNTLSAHLKSKCVRFCPSQQGALTVYLREDNISYNGLKFVESYKLVWPINPIDVISINLYDVVQLFKDEKLSFCEWE